MKKVYLSLPISGYDEQERRMLAARTIVSLKKKNKDWNIINPFDIYDKLKVELLSAGDYSDPHYEDVIAVDLNILSTCDAAYFLQGWQSSRGCHMEMEKCKELGIEVIFGQNDD